MNSLALSDYLNPGAYQKAGCRDHLLYILKNGADYMMKTTFLDSNGDVGAVCYMVSDEGDHSYWGAPEMQNGDRPTYWLTPSSNNSAIVLEMASALAGTAVAFKDSDSAYAAKCTKYAKACISSAHSIPATICRVWVPCIRPIRSIRTSRQ